MRDSIPVFPRRIVAAVGFAGLILAAVVTTSRAQDPGDQLHTSVARQLAHQRAAALQFKIDAIREGARSAMRDARERAELVRRARRGDKAAIRGLRAREAFNDERPGADEDAERSATGARTWTGVANPPLAALATNVIPTNVRCNNPAGDAASAGQAEEAVAAIGNQVVVAWNDGQGFNTGSDVQGFGWSNDGGTTFTDGGNVIHPPAFPLWKWTSDPVVTVNEKTGEFWYCGLANSDATHNAIGIARGRFTAGTFAFDSVFVVRIGLSSSTFLDKQWMAADSLTGNLYVTNTTFGVGGDTIDCYRSTNGGRTWSSPVQISSNADAGVVQGSRPAVGVSGDVSVVYYAADRITDEDNIKIRRSTDGGSSFAGEVLLTKFNQQFGTGAPGFNRERGVNFPSIAVDRTFGPHRGRTYVSWQECWHFLGTPVPVNVSNKGEVEPNGTTATATPFTPGQTLHGTLTTTAGATDLDYYSVALTAGQNLIVFEDSITTTRGWTLRLFAPDGTQRLCYGGKPDTTTTGAPIVYYTFTAPVSGTYFLRMASVTFRSSTYRINTVLGTTGSERGRDQRDGFVSSSDDGNTWSTPTRINDDGIGFDLFLPEVSVGADGSAYTMWFDHRDDAVGSRAHIYMSRSDDGGATWQADQRITSTQSNFTTSGSNIAPNMGDYSHMTTSAGAIYPTWGDGRSTGASGVDVWATAVNTTSDISTCPNDTSMNANSSAPFGWTLANNDPLFGGTYTASMSSERNWPLPAPAGVAIGPVSSAFVTKTVAVPDTAASGVNHVCLTLTTPGGVVVETCCFAITVAGQLAVGDGLHGLALAASFPNPSQGNARIGFSLPRSGHVRLAIYDLAGARVRTLLDGEHAAGLGSATWDGRDDHGTAVHAGAYFYRLEFEGQHRTQRLVLMR